MATQEGRARRNPRMDAVVGSVAMTTSTELGGKQADVQEAEDTKDEAVLPLLEEQVDAHEIRCVDEYST